VNPSILGRVIITADTLAAADVQWTSPIDVCNPALATIPTTPTIPTIYEFRLASGDCNGLIPSGVGRYRSGFKVNVSDLHTSVHVIDDVGRPNDRGYLAIPDDALGDEYYVGTYCSFGGTCQVAITPVGNNTLVSITFPNDVNGALNCTNEPVVAGETLSYTLDEFDVLHFESLSDLSGLHIVASGPVAVVAGARNISTRVFNVYGSTMEMLLPVSKWGTNFIVAPNPDNDAGDVIKIVTYADNTEIKITAFSSFVVPVGGTAVEQRVDWGMHSLVETSAPVMLLQITALDMYNVTNAVVGTPSMTLIPPISLWTSDPVYHPCNVPVTLLAASFDAVVPTQTTNTNTEYVENTNISVYILTHSAARGMVGVSPYFPYGICGNQSSYPLAINWTLDLHVSNFVTLKTITLWKTGIYSKEIFLCYHIYTLV